MKTVKQFLVWIGLILFCAGIALAQAPNMVTYAGPLDGSTKRPSFAGVPMAVDFPTGPTDYKTIKLLSELGARNFNENSNPCATVPKPAVCVRVVVGEPSIQSSSGMVSGYGNRGGYQSGGTFNGQIYPVTLMVFIVVNNDKINDPMPGILLGQATCASPAGTGSSYSAGYGSRGGGMFSSTSSGDLDATIGNAINQDLNALLLKGSWNIFAHPVKALQKFGALGVSQGWVPGAEDTVQQYFRSPSAQKSTGAE